jgi:short-subunit dehydrogenase
MSINYVLITGASQGIGEVFAREFAKRGRNLILVARSKEKMTTISKELASKYSVKVEVIVSDLSDPRSAEKVFESCKSFSVETLINNAGFGLIGDFSNQSLEKIEQMLTVNILTLTKLAHLFIPELKKHKGSLINVASTAAFQPVPYMTAYAATKAYVLHFSEALHAELKAQGVTVLALCPGATKTGFFEAAEVDVAKTNLPMQTAETVVLTAMNALDAKKAFVVTGWKNKAASFTSRLAPRGLVVAIAKKMMGELTSS